MRGTSNLSTGTANLYTCVRGRMRGVLYVDHLEHLSNSSCSDHLIL